MTLLSVSETFVLVLTLFDVVVKHTHTHTGHTQHTHTSRNCTAHFCCLEICLVSAFVCGFVCTLSLSLSLYSVGVDQFVIAVCVIFLSSLFEHYIIECSSTCVYIQLILLHLFHSTFLLLRISSLSVSL
jgi:hypothetical protein